MLKFTAYTLVVLVMAVVISQAAPTKNKFEEIVHQKLHQHRHQQNIHQNNKENFQTRPLPRFPHHEDEQAVNGSTLLHSDAASWYGIHRTGGTNQWLVTPHPTGDRNFQSGEYAYAVYTESMSAVGWNILEIHTNSQFSDLDTAEAAGYIEGYLTAVHMQQSYFNAGSGSALTEKVREFLVDNQKWMFQQIVQAEQLPSGNEERVYWSQVQLILYQLKGLGLGYRNSSTGIQYPLDNMAILSLSLAGDMEDLATAVQDTPPTKEQLMKKIDNGHCSALIRLLEDKSDLFVAQDTWSTFNSMLRTYKLYDFSWKLDTDASAAPVPGQKIAFSSYPGSLFSGDDFYTISSNLVVQETTIGNSNPALYSLITPKSVLEWMRNMVANRLAADGYSWILAYSKYNSGTYNNMNMIVDFNKFESGQKLKDGTLWICEQIPGMIKSNDMSDVLDTQFFFGSYNVAYDPAIRASNGEDKLQQQYGTWFSYSQTARGLIFQRDAPKVHDLPSMKSMMRYNDFKNDPLSTQMNTCEYIGWRNCTPAQTAENTIACRDDLNPSDGVYSLSAFAMRNHAATDAKITSAQLWKNTPMVAHAISGPTYDQQPVFRFSTSPYSNVPHSGLPDAYQFPWVVMSWE